MKKNLIIGFSLGIATIVCIGGIFYGWYIGPAWIIPISGITLTLTSALLAYFYFSKGGDKIQ